jgi:nitrogen-specific signal transduction histidine kinase
MHKLFQPFFTTKPTRQGTELSLSYDIIKAHGGEKKWRRKKVKEQHLLFSCLLSEPGFYPYSSDHPEKYHEE